MKNIKLFKTKEEYENFVWENIITEKLIADHPFYHNLIQFVIDAKTPVFYYQSDPEEHANFSGYYNFELIRETYTNQSLRSMYFLHDFVHSLFYYPYDMSSVTQEEFSDAVILGEYAASNETEIMIHYRIPELRKRIFPDRKIFFDVLLEHGIKTPPPLQSLFQTRKLIIESDILDPFFFTKPEYSPIRDLFKTYRGSRAWCKERFEASLKIKNPTEYFYKFLTPLNYERVIINYISTGTEEEYQRNILMNMKLAFTVLGLENTPENFEDCFKRVGLLEGQVMFKRIA